MRLSFKRTKLKKGASMFEVVIALAVVSLITISVVILAAGSISNATFARNQNVSVRYAQEAIEWLRNERNTDPTNFSSRVTTSIYCLNNLNWNNTGSCGSNEVIPGTALKREVNFTTTSEDNQQGDPVTLVNAEVTVWWTDSKGIHEVKNETEFADFRDL